jgi:hypothetical protein
VFVGESGSFKIFRIPPGMREEPLINSKYLMINKKKGDFQKTCSRPRLAARAWRNQKSGAVTIQSFSLRAYFPKG